MDGGYLSHHLGIPSVQALRFVENLSHYLSELPPHHTEAAYAEPAQ